MSHAAAIKKFLGLLGGPGHAPPENFENIVFRIWLKSHFWTLVTFTDSLKSSSKKSLFEIVVFFSVKLLEGGAETFGGGGSFPSALPVDRTLAAGK